MSLKFREYLFFKLSLFSTLSKKSVYLHKQIIKYEGGLTSAELFLSCPPLYVHLKPLYVHLKPLCVHLKPLYVHLKPLYVHLFKLVHDEKGGGRLGIYIRKTQGKKFLKNNLTNKNFG